MALANSVAELLARFTNDTSLASIVTSVVACSLGLFYFAFYSRRATTNATWYALTSDALKSRSKQQEQWITNCQEVLYGGLKKVKRAIATWSPTGPVVFIPNSFAHEIRNMKELEFGKSLVADFLATYPGLNPIATVDFHDIMQDVVRLDLTRSLDAIAGDMNVEVGAAVKDLLDWKSIDLKPFIYTIIARVSTLVFLGPEVATNQEWLEIAVTYTLNLVRGAQKLRAVPPFLRFIVQWWIPELKLCRQQVTKAREIINPVVEDRIRRKATGEITEKTADMISWVDDKARAKGVKIDFASLQLNFATAALHTTTETISFFMLDVLGSEKETGNTLDRLRKELVAVLSEHGLRKSSLSSMTLLDSALKESQRMNTLNNAVANVTLSDGTIIPKGFKLAVESKMDDPELYPNPEKFDIDRFVQLREINRNKWHYVTGSPEHLAFGYGKHICPGRFFASNEIKIVLMHLLIKYDWKFVPDQGRFPRFCSGTEVAVDPRQKLMVKSRPAEIDLGSL
ncbi:hypothetical protein COCC4DRAFT_58089 [Bipolaris maydis ATCC 48331]|uniref:Cytochrome P450 monooxygenase n=2 Tax=Cochliobolus heterostrophus TaxID=5016 RepID=M2UFP9_COCH5|nr:uncharacterized protein COCC4DRAFT_58089 [Bipolaris maydis ATCC 48331]EMD92531.1 hypothetical protein COCHEDRAFT_1100778 [Bipolaris maydis C5]KAJ5022351.1 cytochrome P450 [Bipolaris maydis]ENI08226.1 hypothetical protein COCC4DRAFT_58089 [Bipolaris maydis ATCC 48331]KAJ6272150.1 cytochrome P450 [Bipolaris maydis]KAJ6281758.1 cytochrome P450 [Bipolaris maydis]